MSGGTFARCPSCGRLVIYGQTCTCGQRTDLPCPTPDDDCTRLGCACPPPWGSDSDSEAPSADLSDFRASEVAAGAGRGEKAGEGL